MVICSDVADMSKYFHALGVSGLTLTPCCQNLRWLDLKDNPLEPDLAKAAGDCLDEKQCKQCSSKV